MKYALWILLLVPQPSFAGRLLKALTFNAAGIPIVHSYWNERRASIGEKLREGQYDLVVLQETWFDKDALALAESAGLTYYTRYERNISFGTGLTILSRYPIIEKHQRPFTCRPSALRWMSGESVANKGILMVRVQTPQGPLDVYTAHLTAQYPEAKYRTLRWSQIYELSEMVMEFSAGRPFLIMGDLNTAPEEPGYKLLIDLLGLEDACMDKGKDVCGVTVAEDNARIDHILGPRGPGRFGAAHTAFSGNLPGTKIAYSDHLALEDEIDSRIMSRRLNPDSKARGAALQTIESSIDRMTAAMVARLLARSWIPVYGVLLVTRYEHQIAQLAEIGARAESARIRLLYHGR
jgi:endonuclease/exonuclease/phosphatase family metal-dependent hydrolase